MTTKGGVVGHSAMCVLEALRPGPYDRRGEGRCRSCRRTHPRSTAGGAAQVARALHRNPHQEAVAKWKVEAGEFEVRGEAMLNEFAEFYPEMAKRIANHLDDMRAFDKQVDDLNRRRPNGVPALSRSTPALAKDLRIPSPCTTGQLWWPPPQPNLALEYLAAMPPDPFVGQEAAKDTYIKARDRRVLEDNRRQIAEAEQRQREFEKRKAAEMAKVTKADMGRAVG